jgi:transposase-like protein
MGKRRRFTAEFKASVVRAALRDDKTISQLASEYGVHPNQISEWKRVVLESLPDLFSHRKKSDEKERCEKEERLLRQIGKLSVEVDWLKKKSDEYGIDY